ncbi:MAG TPA: hypothetical protein PKA41_01485, partial [Verrucomicrobiota bacterium]|nr:hypothetical protein [Verrucomicrobiota bacterium]
MKKFIKVPKRAAVEMLSLCCVLMLWQSSEQAKANTIADSILDFSATQGSNNWYYGYYPAPGNDLSLAVFVELDGFIDNYWHHASVWFPPWTAIDNISLHPNGTNSIGGEEWAVKRWVSPDSMTVNLSGLIAKDDLGGNGVTAYIVLDGTVIYTTPIAPNDTVGVTF